MDSEYQAQGSEPPEQDVVDLEPRGSGAPDARGERAASRDSVPGPPDAPAPRAEAAAAQAAAAQAAPAARNSHSGGDVPATGDPSIDAVLAELADVRDQPLEAHIATGEKAHRVLQGRLNDLGGE